MLLLAFRNLLQNRVRLMISVGGVALALMLILSLDAIMTGIERQVTAYIDHSGADVWVSQQNVRNMHMASSALSAAVVNQVKNLPGVKSATPILYMTSFIEMGADRSSAYVIGLPDDPVAGGPWHIVAGKSNPGKGGIIIDRGIAYKSGLGIGDKVKLLGEEFKIAGLDEGTASAIGGSVAFISKKDWQRLEGSYESVSFVLVQVEPGQSADAVASEIEGRVNKVTAQTQQAFAEQERQVVDDMSTDIVTIMNMVGFLIGLAVMALTVYTATLARRAEYGLLKGLGARNSHLCRAVLGQAFISVGLGFGIGLAFTIFVAAFAPNMGANLSLEVSGTSLVQVSGVSLVIAALSALMPIRQISGLDPALVFRGK